MCSLCLYEASLPCRVLMPRARENRGVYPISSLMIRLAGVSGLFPVIQWLCMFPWSAAVLALGRTELMRWDP